MNTKVVTGIVVVLALAVVGWWYWAAMVPSALAPADTENPEESVNAVAVSDETAATMLAGTWQSKEDARFRRVFMADGTVTDSYEGIAEGTVNGEWSFVTDLAAEQPNLPVVKDARVLKIQFPEEALYFAITGLSETDLSMIYLMGNGSLEFTRVN